MAEETDLWQETASMRDFYVNPVHWLLTLVTLGMYWLVVFITRYYTRYRLTSQRIIMESGLLGKRIDEIELFRVKDTRLHQSLVQRIVGLGDIEITSTDVSGSYRITMLPGARDKREQIRTLSMRAREQAGVRTIINE